MCVFHVHFCLEFGRQGGWSEVFVYVCVSYASITCVVTAVGSLKPVCMCVCYVCVCMYALRWIWKEDDLRSGRKLACIAA
jgi:hypothetical protein